MLSSSYLNMAANWVTFFFLTPYLLDKLGDEKYGIWVLLLNIITYFSLSNFGFNTSFMMNFPAASKSEYDRNTLINTVFFTLLFMSMLFSGIFIFIDINLNILFKIPESLLENSKFAFCFVFIGFLMTIFYGFFDSMLYITNKITLKNLVELGKILFTNLLIFIVVVFSGGILSMSVAQLIGFTVFLVTLYLLTKREILFEVDFRWYSQKLFIKLLSPSFHYFLIAFASQIVFYSDTLLISNLAGIACIAIYSIMYKLTDVFLRILFKFSDIKLPAIAQLFSESRFADLIKLHNKLQLVTFLFALPIFFTLFFWGTDLLVFWLGSDHYFDKNIMRVLSISMLLNSIIHVTALFVTAMGIHQKVSYMSLFEAFLNIVLSIILFRVIGLVGIPLGTLIATLGTTGWYIFHKFYSYSYHHLEKKC